MKQIKTWHERCEEHPDHQERIISESMIQARMQEEIDELRQALEEKQKTAVSPGKGTGFNYARALGITVLRPALETKQKTAVSPDGGTGFIDGVWHEPGPTAWQCQCGKPYTVTCISSKPAKREWVGLTDEEIDALSQARSLTDELMDCVDRLGSEADTVDPRVWQHLLVYAPKPEEEPVAWMHNFIEGNVITHIPADIGRHPERWTPLYTAPPKQWVGLTDEDYKELSKIAFVEVIEKIERVLKEKNA